jgi:hypothetical protein
MDTITSGARPRRRALVYSCRMLAAMLCWTALQSVATQLDDGRARAAAQLPAGGPAR